MIAQQGGVFVSVCVCVRLSVWLYSLAEHKDKQCYFFSPPKHRKMTKNIKCCVSFYFRNYKLSRCFASALRLMTECESRRGTAANSSLSQRWTQSQSSIATFRRKVCLCFFLICFSIFASHSQQDPCLRFLLCLVVVPVFHGFVLLSVKTPCLCFFAPPRLPLAVKCSLPGESSDLLSGSTHSVP